MKARRQSAVLEVIQREPVRSQEQLRRRLRTTGINVTQATVSRDIRELGLVKGGPGGAYQPPAVPVADGRTVQSTLQRTIGEYLARVDQVQQMVLLRTGPGEAQILCVALDRARLPEVVGTVAGEDTILVVTPDARRAKAFVRRLQGRDQRRQ